MSHTKGPWKIGRQIHTTGNYAINAENELTVCYVMHGRSGYMDVPQNNHEIAANAALIAAAPELLQACEAMLNCIDPARDWKEAKQARAALTKARGRG